jgi:hypothetical protein
MGAIGVTTCAASCPRCVACLLVTGSALSAPPPLRRRSCLPGRPPPAADQVRRMTVWLAGCVPARMAPLPCCCAAPVMGAFTCAALGCVAGVRLLAIGSARVALAHILPLLATRAAARGPMALALRPCTIHIIIILLGGTPGTGHRPCCAVDAGRAVPSRAATYRCHPCLLPCTARSSRLPLIKSDKVYQQPRLCNNSNNNDNNNNNTGSTARGRAVGASATKQAAYDASRVKNVINILVAWLLGCFAFARVDGGASYVPAGFGAMQPQSSRPAAHQQGMRKVPCRRA